MKNKIGLWLVKFIVGDLCLKIVKLSFLLFAAAILFAVFVFNWRPGGPWPLAGIASFLALILLAWAYLCRYLVIHPNAGVKNLENFFVELRESDSRLLSWQSGNFFFPSGLGKELLFVSIALPAALLPGPAGKLVQKISCHKLKIYSSLASTASMAPLASIKLELMIFLSGPYVFEEVIRFLVSVRADTGKYFQSYEEYINAAFVDFLPTAIIDLGKNGLTTTEKLNVDMGALAGFLEKKFQSRKLSNVLYFALAFRQEQ